MLTVDPLSSTRSRIGLYGPSDGFKREVGAQLLFWAVVRYISILLLHVGLHPSLQHICLLQILLHLGREVPFPLQHRLSYVSMGTINSQNDSKGIAFLVVDIVFIVLAAVAVGLRLWARRLKRSPLALNDYSVIAALVRIIRIPQSPSS